ncbi:MAG TPA: phosphorylated adapter RNA export RNA-binding domain-containing protein, partial [Herpetosiphonaceae bacterium]|nr:phosphorylated adapter RNA export RNA-binding domain-containing protein [Herpetosiphonaceae bacterium]
MVDTDEQAEGVPESVPEPEPTPEPVPTARARPQLTPEQQASRQAAMRIADALGERVTGPRAQVGRVVQVLGIERAQAIYEQTLEVEAAGGMMLPDGSRRRTLGGVFFKLVRDSVSDTDREKIFPLQ